jgi:DNA-binding NarL/FixJ family response regulator
MAGQETLRSIAYVEDDARFRFHFAELLARLDRSGGIRTFATAEAFLEALEACQEAGDPLPWDLVFVDIGLPRIGGVELINRLREAYPKTLILALTVFEEPAQILAAIAAGANGYLLKTSPTDLLLRDIDQALRFGASFSPALADAVLDLVRAGASRALKPEKAPLSKRQLDVLRGLSEGDSYRAIAEKHNLSIDTVRSHVRHIYAYLHVKTAREAVGKAFRRNLI